MAPRTPFYAGRGGPTLAGYPSLLPSGATMIALLCLHIPTTAADTTDEWYIPCPAEGTWRIKNAFFAPATAVAANDTNYVQVDLTKNTLAAPTTWVAFATAMTTQVTGGAAMVIGTAREFTLASTAREIVQGEIIKVAKTDPGTGAILDGTLTIELEKVK